MHYGFYLFESVHISRYIILIDPPQYVTYDTQHDRITRFNPNLYIDGRVCLSLLNTWKGEGWSSCQSIRTILLVLSTVLNDFPIENEPGLKKTHQDNHNYNNMIRYKNLEVAIIGMLSKRYLDARFNQFYDIITEKFLDNKYNIIDFFYKLKTDLIHIENCIINFNLYNSKYIINLANIESKLKKINNTKIDNNN